MDNVNLIRKMAWNFHNSTGVAYDELHSEATIAYLESKQKFDTSRKVPFGSYSAIIIRNRLIDFCKQEKRERRLSWDDCENTVQHPTDTSQQFYENILEDLPNDVKEVIVLILKNAKNLEENIPIAKWKVKQMLRDKEWTWSRIKNVQAQITLLLNEIPIGTLNLYTYTNLI